MLSRIKEDIACVFGRDPAAQSVWEVVTAYPGFHAVLIHRLSHKLWNAGLKWLARFLAHIGRFLTGIEIHPGAQIGRRFFIDHGMGVVIGETAEVGHDVTIYHGVTLGGTSLEHGKRHPTIGDRVTIGAGAKVLGALNVGHDSRIGANAVLVRSVEDNSVVVGVPGQVIARTRKHTAADRPDLDNAVVPDPVGSAVQSLLARVEALEDQLSAHTDRSARDDVRMVEVGMWESAYDFSI